MDSAKHKYVPRNLLCRGLRPAHLDSHQKSLQNKELEEANGVCSVLKRLRDEYVE